MDPRNEGTDLAGRRILFVGGLVRQVARLRDVVEARNGRFVHHDGGVEQSIPRLRVLLEGCDVVLFPVNCVSHSAQSELKRLCRSRAKPYLPMRGMGMGAFVCTIETLSRGTER